MGRLISGERDAANMEKMLAAHYAAERAALQSSKKRKAAVEACVTAVECALKNEGDGAEMTGPVKHESLARGVGGNVGNQLERGGAVCAEAGERANTLRRFASENSLGRLEDSLGSASRPSRMHSAKTRPSSPSFLSFAAFQARAIPARIWIAQAALIALVLWVCALEPAEGFVNCMAAALGAIVAGMGVPVAMASRSYRMAELESACRFNCRSVAAARMVVVGGADVLLLGVAACAAPSLTNAYALTFAVYACVPYFAVCAGSFAVSRRARGFSAMAISAALSLLAMGICVFLQQVFPWVYEPAAVGLWAIAAAVTGVWLAREAYAFLCAAAEGIDAFGCLGRLAHNEKGCDISWS
jgi:hypothetical protein